MRRGFLWVLAAILMISCSFAQSLLARYSPFTSLTPTAYPSVTPIPVMALSTSTPDDPTATPTPPCDPFTAFCVLDGHFFFQRPISPPNRVTAENSYLFGSTEEGVYEPHHGVDLPNATGTQVLAVADGTVVFAGSDDNTTIGPWTDFYGNVIIILHRLEGIPTPIYSLYGHLSEVDAVPGQAVHAGDLIGLVGSTGAAMGSHLHFEVRAGDNTYDNSTNPALWLIPLEGKGVIAGRVVDEKSNMIHVKNLRIQFYPSDPSQANFALQVETYAPEQDHVSSDADLQENFAVGDLAAGRYRLVFEDNGVYDRWVEVQAGKLTYMEFVVK
jgi:hypothetical protein